MAIIADRTAIRMELATLLAGLPDVQSVYPYPPLGLRGESPIVSVHNDGAEAVFGGVATNIVDCKYVVTIYVNRKAHGAEASENILDGVYRDIVQLIRDNVTGVFYDEVVVMGSSTPGFAVIDGIPYRYEEVGLLTRTYCE